MALEPENAELVRQLASIHMAQGEIEEGQRLMKSLQGPPKEVWHPTLCEYPQARRSP